MSKLYYVSTKTITQAERMREKLNFLADAEFWKVQYQGKDGYPKLTDEDVEKCFENICSYKDKSKRLTDALNGIVDWNRGTWNDIETIKAFAYERDILDAEIECLREQINKSIDNL